jgi:hypothetical protein
MYVSYTTDRPGASVGHSEDALALKIVFGFFDMFDLCICDALPRWHCSWTVLLIQCV